jgi:hypothetical protein
MRSNNLPVHFIEANGFDLMCHKQANLQLQYELTYVTDNLLNLFLGKKKFSPSQRYVTANAFIRNFEWLTLQSRYFC